MDKLRSFSITGAEKNKQKALRLDEIVIYGAPETLRKIGLFFIGISHEMEFNDVDHAHLQDKVKNFSRKKHCDIILINKNVIQKI